MPELPEVETIIRALNSKLKGAEFSTCRFIRLNPWNPESDRTLSHIFHPFKEKVPALFSGSLKAYLSTYEEAMRLSFEHLKGYKIENITRRGKYLIFNFKTSTHNEPVQLVSHLKMAGRFLLNPATIDVKDPAQYIHLVLAFKKQQREQTLVYSDRRFGEVLPWLSPEAVKLLLKKQKLTAVRTKQLEVIYQILREIITKRLDQIGFEPIISTVSSVSKNDKERKPLLVVLKEMVQTYKARGRKRSLYHVLLDGSEIAGIGNIYANEICHRALVHPLKMFGALSDLECRRLATATEYILSAAIESAGTSLDNVVPPKSSTPQKSSAPQKPSAPQSKGGGSKGGGSKKVFTKSIKAGHFRSPEGNPGTYARGLRVYGRAGISCLRRGCEGNVERIVEQGRSVYVCPVCQH